VSNPQTVTRIGNGAFRVERADGTQAVAFGVADGARTWVFLDGQTYVIESSPTRRAAGGHDPSALTAPMPANVTQVHVVPGQQVHAGDVLITLEAMKMELPIRATTDGVVAAINCRVGEMVQPGGPLIEIK
jgi:oxaloacetate decarboxylase (Na+ extruding) subunit alpha